MDSEDDHSVWREVKKETVPIEKKPSAEPKPVRYRPKRFKPSEPSDDVMYPKQVRISLRHKTVQEAYDDLFLAVREASQKGIKSLLVITGKGPDGQGIIRRELPGWMDTDVFAPYVRSYTQAAFDEGGEGAYKLTIICE